jgi:hypothetical protein
MRGIENGKKQKNDDCGVMRRENEENGRRKRSFEWTKAGKRRNGNHIRPSSEVESLRYAVWHIDCHHLHQ